MEHRNIITRLYKLATDEKQVDNVKEIASLYIRDLERDIRDCQEKIDNYKMLIDELNEKNGGN